MNPMRIGVIGAGPMGRLHARAIARRSANRGDVRLARIVDRHLARAERVAEEFGGAGGETLAPVFGELDAAVVAVPPAAHVEVAERLLQAGIDVLVEKPLALTPASAMALTRSARERGRVLGVGHVEWFNPLLVAARAAAGPPVCIEVERLGPPSPRGLEIDVVQDSMIHDLDWVVRTFGEEPLVVEAEARRQGAAGPDDVEARLVFPEGREARLRASRVHSERRRWVHLAGRRADVTVDLVTGSIEGDPAPVASGAEEPLDLLWDDFLAACTTRGTPVNSGAVGVAVLERVDRVREAIAKRAGR